MEKAEISLHQWKIYDCLMKESTWLSNRDIAHQTGVSLRRVSFHTNNLVQLGILDQAEVYPGHRFKISAKADKRNSGYLRLLQQLRHYHGLT